MARPTGRGLGLLAAAAGAYLAARVVGTWELYLVSLAFVAALLVAWLLVAATAPKLEGARTVTPERPTAGDPLAIALRVRNGSLLPGLQLTVPDAAGDLSEGHGELQVESLGSRAQRVVSARPQPARRGVHRLPALRARAEDPLGLARADRRLGEPLELTVYPRLVHLTSCALWPGMGARPERGHRGLAVLGASEFRGVRPHNPGEPLSRIDWKATAKTGSLMLREMDDPTSGDVTLLLDASSSSVVGAAPDTNLELAVEAAGSVADLALRAGRGVNLLLPQDEWRQTRLAPGADGRGLLLDSLARVSPQRTVRLGPSLRTLLANRGRRWRTEIVTLVVLALDRELVRGVIALRREGLQVSLIHVSAASFLPAAPPSSLRDAAGPVAAEAQGLSLSLAAAGIPWLTVSRGDDLRSALSLRHTDARHALLR